MPGRRELVLTSYDQIMPEVDRLIERGHTTGGNWTLAQICNHLSSSLIWSVEGFPIQLPRVVQATFGAMILNRILKTGKIRPNAPAPKKLLPQPDLDLRAEAEALRSSVAYYVANGSKRAPNPLFGVRRPEVIDRFNLIHIAHHLGYAWPKTAD